VYRVTYDGTCKFSDNAQPESQQLIRIKSGDVEKPFSGSFTQHLARRAGILADRVELEFTVAGLQHAPLERAVFKATKSNTKAPKEKHIKLLYRAIAADGKQQSAVLSMLKKRMNEVCALAPALPFAPVGTSACLAGGMKTLAVWHRCLNSEENSFISLCAQHAHVLELPASIPAAVQQYGAYLKQLLVCCFKCKYAYHRDELELDSRVDTLKVEEVVVHGTCILAQLELSARLFDYDTALVDPTARQSLQYAFNLLLLDAVGLWRACQRAATRAKGFVQLSAKDACKIDYFYLQYSNMTVKLLEMLRQLSFDTRSCPPTAAFNQGKFDKFRQELQDAQHLLVADTKTLADSATAFSGEAALSPSVAFISTTKFPCEQTQLHQWTAEEVARFVKSFTNEFGEKASVYAETMLHTHTHTHTAPRIHKVVYSSLTPQPRLPCTRLSRRIRQYDVLVVTLVLLVHAHCTFVQWSATHTHTNTHTHLPTEGKQGLSLVCVFVCLSPGCALDAPVMDIVS